MLDLDLLTALRPSYRYIAYRSTGAGSPLRTELPGVDKPESVDLLRSGELQWLLEVS